MNELEQDPRILSCSWHVGYIRHDSDVAGCGIVVVPATEKDSAYAETVADQLAAYVWDRRHEFHYTGPVSYTHLDVYKRQTLSRKQDKSSKLR